MWNKERAFHAGSDTDIIAYGTESVSGKTIAGENGLNRTTQWVSVAERER